MKMFARVLLALVLVTCSTPAFAAENEGESEPVTVSADRPSFSAGASVVPMGHVQFELGADLATTDGGSILTVPQLFVRAGANDVAEFRIGIPSYAAGLGVDDPGAGTTEFSLKIAGDVTESFSAGVLPFVRFFDYDEMTPYGRSSLGFLGLWGFSLTDSIGTFGNVGLSAVPGSGAGSPTVFELAASLGASLALSDAFGLYVEAFLTQADEDPNVGVDGGVSLSVLPWLALDAYAGAGLSGEVSDVFGGIGVSLVQ